MKGLSVQALEANRDSEEVTVARGILEWSEETMPSIFWGKGKVDGAFIPVLDHRGIWHQVIGVATNGSVEIQFQYMKRKPPFDTQSKRIELRDHLNEIDTIEIPATHVTDKRPWFYLAKLKKSEDLDHFLEVLDWFVREVKAT